ncbi:hypothetical protein DM02DRAFT_603687 [Periconia macrospinosa]|uniref:Fe2OG dioxygenase domain-containing protein n=1 Tax=Periconia macrospinosa TaxID=97972 RepID=A0A2V1D6K7_9PLEO|nr:hypothetical protein DM02DRAFT_603687 [Periconia macrospinosa]
MPPSKKKPPKPTTTTTSRSTPPPPPNWPPLTPLLPTSSLSLQTVLPSQILTIPHLFTPTLCKTYVSFLSTLPLVTTPANPKKGDAVRVNDRFQIEDKVFAERLWEGTGLRGLVLGEGEGEDGEGEEEGGEEKRRELWGGDVLGLNPNIRIYRYTPGQHFAPHYDDSNTLSFPPPTTTTTSPPRTSTALTHHLIPALTTWTLLLYLTSCVGGETVFYPSSQDEPTGKKSKKKKGKEGSSSVGVGGRSEPIVCEMEVGMALLHRHGRECLLHEGREVREGVKWVIRSDVCVRR